MADITALQTYALPGGVHGPYPVPYVVKKQFTLPAARALTMPLKTSLACNFILVAELQTVLPLGV